VNLSYRVGRYCDIFKNIENIENILFFNSFEFFWYFRYVYRTFAHTLLKLYRIYYQIIVCVCVCALHIRWNTLVIHTALLWRGAIWQKLSNTEKMLRAQVISQQNTWTENLNVVTMCHINKYFLKNSIKIENSKISKISDIFVDENNGYFRYFPIFYFYGVF